MDQKQEIRKCEDALKVLWILKGTRVAYDALTGNAPWWWSVQKNDLSHKQKILSEEATFNILTHISQDLLEETSKWKKAKAVQNIVEQTTTKNVNSIRNSGNNSEHVL